MTIEERAKKFIKENIDMNNYPEDAWYRLTDKFDLNVYIDYAVLRATVFPVVDGKTDITRYIDIM